jgi:hypothetical protein
MLDRPRGRRANPGRSIPWFGTMDSAIGQQQYFEFDFFQELCPDKHFIKKKQEFTIHATSNLNKFYQDYKTTKLKKRPTTSEREKLAIQKKEKKASLPCWLRSSTALLDNAADPPVYS